MSTSKSVAVFVTRKVIRHALIIHHMHEKKLRCSDCKFFPEKPVTGKCGHTRCIMCIERNGSCPCGALQPEIPYCNILIREILESMQTRMSRQFPQRIRLGAPSSSNSQNESELSILPTRSQLATSGGIRQNAQLFRLHRRLSIGNLTHMRQDAVSLRRTGAYPRMQYQHARELLLRGRCREAAAHLAHIAASSEPMARTARKLLLQVIMGLSSAGDPRRLTGSLFRSMRTHSLSAIEPAMLKCPICYSILANPVTTPCGHTFCKSCIYRALQTRNMCPLCSSTLSNSYMAQTADNEFVCAVLSTSIPKLQLGPDFVPILKCSLAFPDVACPLMLYNLRHVLRHVMDPKSQRRGMLALMGRDPSNYGTMVEIRDCVLFKDGKCLVTTMGIKRIQVAERVTINGFQYARVSDIFNLSDTMPSNEATIANMQVLAKLIKQKVNHWMPRLSLQLQLEIIICFGIFPEMDLESEWWNNPNGPAWLWWLVAIMPLKPEVQMLILSSTDLPKRLAAISRTMDTVLRIG